jgi:Flp pilus assembly protein TadG
MRQPIRKTCGRIPRRRRRRGVSLCELAILLPFLGFLFAVAVDYCRVFHYTQVLEACAQNGALYASGTAPRNNASTVTAEDAGKQAALDEGARLSPALASNDVEVTVDGSSATVVVTYTFRTLTSFPGIPSSIALTRRVTLPRAPRTPGAS